MRRSLTIFALALVAACRAAPESRREPPAQHEAILLAADVDAGSGALPPLAADWMERLELPGGGLAYVAPPVGSTEPRPVVVAVHGAVDDPGLMCSAWRLIADVYPFVVCPAGAPVAGAKFVWRSSDAIERALESALTAVRARWGERVHPGPAVYAAFSQGANMAGGVLGGAGNRGARDERPGFARAVLTEGGYRAFEGRAFAKAFAAAGGERVLFTCSQPGCASGFERSREPLSRAGVDVRVTYSGPHGHSIPPPVRESIHAALPWVVEGLPGWDGYASAPKLSTH